MNGLLWAIIMLAWLWGGYFIYGKIIEKKLIQPDDSRSTPAVEYNDGVDYSPAKTPILFGHHFSSIAGAGPIVGPIIAVLYFGWLAASLWVALGAVFMGAVHDYTALMVSVRNKGSSLADVAETAVSHRAKVIFAIFIWITLVLVVAVFGVVTAKTFIGQPQIVVPTFALILIAIFFGWLVYRMGVPIWIGTVAALILVAIFLYAGDIYPISLPRNATLGFLASSPSMIWFVILMIYALFASVLPVWLLLQPRDYLSMWLLFLGMGLGYIGLIFAHPTINAPAFTSFTSKGGPLWPMLFVIIACGAISGFHSLVAGGTTSKQLEKESSGKIIGYGAMIMEATLATLVIVIGAAALKWDPSGKLHLGYQFLMNKSAGGGPIKAFAVGFGQLVKEIPGLNSKIGIYVGMLMLNGFVITTLDTATRLARFVLQELTRDTIPFIANRWIATIVTIAFAWYFGATGSWKTIWPVFGASNQLVAALALTVVSAYFLGVKKPLKYTVIPAILMLVTTMGALLYQAYKFIFVVPKLQIAITALILFALALFIFLEAKDVFIALFRTQKQTS